MSATGSCPACGAVLQPWRSIPSSEPALGPERFQLLRCGRCGSAVTQGDAGAELYESGAYQPRTPRLHALAAPLLRLFDRQRLGLVAPLMAPPARLLDVGAGRGRFVASARHAGYDAFGIEPSERGNEAAAALGVRIQRATIEEAAIEPASLDVVVLWHVLEHLDDPAAALSRAGGWLHRGGVLLVGVPNLSSLQARLSGRRWFHLDVPRHRVHFSRMGLELLLDASGYRLLGTRHVLLEHNVFGMWQSLLNLLTTHPSYLYNLLKRNAPLRSADLPISLAALPFVPLAALLELAAGLAGRGGTIAAVARRTED